MDVFYFGEDSRRLFGALSRPSGAAHTGLVICPPFGDEMVCSYARFARWAKELTEAGFAVLRYHAYGTGESDGSGAAFSLEGASNDARTALRRLREHVEVEQAGFFGLRFGAAVAVLAASSAKPDFAVLWSPIVNLQQYFRELLRLRLTKELVHQQAAQVKITAKDMIRELEAGRSIDLLGYEVSPDLYRQMSVRPSWPEQPPAANVLWVARPPEESRAVAVAETWRGRGSQVDLRVLAEPVFWEDFSSALPHQFMDVSFRWMTQRVPVGQGCDD